jgi:hypothetical protein
MFWGFFLALIFAIIALFLSPGDAEEAEPDNGI